MASSMCSLELITCQGIAFSELPHTHRLADNGKIVINHVRVNRHMEYLLRVSVAEGCKRLAENGRQRRHLVYVGSQAMLD